MICTDRSPDAGLLNKSSCLAPALGVTKLTNAGGMILVTLFFAAYVRLSRCSTNPPMYLLLLRVP